MFLQCIGDMQIYKERIEYPYSCRAECNKKTSSDVIFSDIHSMRQSVLWRFTLISVKLDFNEYVIDYVSFASI